MSPVQVNPLAAHASACAVRLLPRAERPKYVEEYHSELYELARISRRAQWAYAVRLLVCSPLIRRELRREKTQGQRARSRRPSAPRRPRLGWAPESH